MQKCNLNNIFHVGKGHFATGKRALSKTWGGGGPPGSYSPVFELLTTIAHRHFAGVSEKGLKAQFSLLSGGF